MSGHYKYAMLRYSHNVTSGESLNVGVVVYSWEQRYLKACFTTKGTRLRNAFKDFEIGYYREMAKFLNAAFESRAASLAEMVNDRGQEHTASMRELLESILPHDDSALQWSEIRGGIGEDLDAVFEHLYQLYIGRYEEKNREERRSDENIWQKARANWTDRRVVDRLVPKTVLSPTTGLDVTFDYSFKNGIWNCYQPLSFDLKKADSITEKAYKHAGRLNSLHDAAKELQIYYLIGNASDQKLAKVQNGAERCLLDVGSTKPVIIREDEFADWSRDVAQLVEAHA